MPIIPDTFLLALVGLCALPAAVGIAVRLFARLAS